MEHQFHHRLCKIKKQTLSRDCFYMRATLAFNGLINKPQKTNFIVNTQRSFSTVPKVPGKIKAFSF